MIILVEALIYPQTMLYLVVRCNAPRARVAASRIRAALSGTDASWESFVFLSTASTENVCGPRAEYSHFTPESTTTTPARPTTMQIPQPRKPRQQPIARFVRRRFADDPTRHGPMQPRHITGNAALQPDFGGRNLWRPALHAQRTELPDIVAFAAAGETGGRQGFMQLPFSWISPQRTSRQRKVSRS